MKKNTMHKFMTRLTAAALIIAIPAALSACDTSKIKKETSYPTSSAKGSQRGYTDDKKETIWGDGITIGDKIFGGDEKQPEAGIGVNSFLWRAALDTIAFMPVQSADPFGGVILTDWYENADAPGERYKINVYILDRQLRADGVRVSVFKQVENRGQWKDTDVGANVATDIENTILTRARELKVAQQAAD